MCRRVLPIVVVGFSSYFSIISYRLSCRELPSGGTAVSPVGFVFYLRAYAYQYRPGRRSISLGGVTHPICHRGLHGSCCTDLLGMADPRVAWNSRVGGSDSPPHDWWGSSRALSVMFLSSFWFFIVRVGFYMLLRMKRFLTSFIYLLIYISFFFFFSRLLFHMFHGLTCWA